MTKPARRERIEFRTTLQLKALAERAAAARGASLGEYISSLVEKDAIEVLRREGEITVTNAQFDNFIAVCMDESHVPSSRILEAARRLDQEGL
jgi:uncharacterized protein (DUF1778 family)